MAGKKQAEITMLQNRMEKLELGKEENSRKPLQIIELTQGIANKYVSLKSSQKRGIVNYVFSNLSLDGISLCAE